MTFADAAAQESHHHASHTRRFGEDIYPLCLQEPLFSGLVLKAWNRDQPICPGGIRWNCNG